MNNIYAPPTPEKDIAEVIIAILLTIPNMFLRGWTIQLLWNWFLVPVGMLSIGLAQGLGIGTLFGLMCIVIPNTTTTKITPIVLILTDIVRCGFSLFFGLVFHLIMIHR